MSPEPKPQETKPGDVVVVSGHRVGERERVGQIVELFGEAGRMRYRVRWEDGHETILHPGSDAVIRHTAPRRERS